MKLAEFFLWFLRGVAIGWLLLGLLALVWLLLPVQ